MIISASYRTDIPAFYAEWFARRVEAGSVRFRNPFGGRMVDVSLMPRNVDGGNVDGGNVDGGNVDGIVFWTRNFGPMMDRLDPVITRRWPFVVQYTVTGYPKVLEPSVIPVDRAIGQMALLTRRFGSRSVVWRYDPIVIGSATPADWHVGNFSRIAARLRGTVDEVVVSFVEPYRKTRRNMDRLATMAGLTWRLPELDEKAALTTALKGVAAEAGMTLTLCAQPALVERADNRFEPARCIDADRLSDVAGRAIGARTKGNRHGCLCARSRDIGAYDTCPHGCAYCYAVADRERAKANYGRLKSEPGIPHL